MVSAGPKEFVRAAALAALVCAACGCAGPIEHWIVDTRIRQGDVALGNGNVQEAQLAYRLALKVDPQNRRARAGYAAVGTQIAENEYTAGRLEDALATISSSLKYAPESVRLQALRNEVEQAKIKREIVVSNYPIYRQTGSSMRHSYLDLKAMTAQIVTELKRFDYTYDINTLNKAIQDSYALNAAVGKNTNRLITFRQLVESGVPESQKSSDTGTLPPPASLLPLP